MYGRAPGSGSSRATSELAARGPLGETIQALQRCRGPSSTKVRDIAGELESSREPDRALQALKAPQMRQIQSCAKGRYTARSIMGGRASAERRAERHARQPWPRIDLSCSRPSMSPRLHPSATAPPGQGVSRCAPSGSTAVSPRRLDTCRPSCIGQLRHPQDGGSESLAATAALFVMAVCAASWINAGRAGSPRLDARQLRRRRTPPA